MEVESNTSLDSIRRLAILMVTMSHLCRNSYIYGLKDYKMLGKYDMSFAFLIDGYKITLSYISFLYIENIHKNYINWKFKCKN